jgi:hypothetical protein
MGVVRARVVSRTIELEFLQELLEQELLEQGLSELKIKNDRLLRPRLLVHKSLHL